MAVGFPTKANWAAGDVLTASAQDDLAGTVNLLSNASASTGQYLVSNTAGSSFVYNNNFAAGKNQVLNGAFDIWQRGTSFSYTGSGSSTYTADRCSVYVNGNGTFTFSRQTFTPGSAPVAGYEGQYYYRFAVNTLGTSTAAYILQNKLENVQTFAGQTVTLSFWARSDAARTLNVALTQVFGTGGSSPVALTSTVSATTSWARYTYTVALGSMTGKTIGAGSYLEIRIDDTPTASQTVDIWGLQLEAGSVATAFQTATGTLSGELALCQRYYIRQGGDTAYQTLGWGQAFSSTSLTATMTLPVPMRVAPTSVEFSTLRGTNLSANYSISAMNIDTNFNSRYQPTVNCTTTGLTAANFYYLCAFNSTSAYLAFSAEL